MSLLIHTLAMDTAVQIEVSLHEQEYSIVLNSLAACCKPLRACTLPFCSEPQAAFLVQS